MASMQYDIPLLDRNTRFDLWQVKMRDVLIQMDLHEALLGFERMPPTWSDEEKQIRDMKASSLIRLHLSNDILKDVLKENSAAELWLKLEKLCSTKSMRNKLHLKLRFYSLRLSEGGSISYHVSQFKEIVSGLKNMDVKYDQEDLRLIFLCSLPSSYVNFRDAILYSCDTLEEVFVLLCPDEKTKHNRRQIPPPKRYVEGDLVAYALTVAQDIESIEEPSTFNEAVNSKDADKWIVAMYDEMESLQKNNTWDLVPLPKGEKTVHCKWLYSRKDGKLGCKDSIFKAQLVAAGYDQVRGFDFTDGFFSVAKHSSLRALLGLVALHNLELEQLDVKTAFLHGELEEHIYMDQPEGFVRSGKEDLVCKMKKSLNGLKNSSRQWYKRFNSFMSSCGFSRCSYDNCVYSRRCGDQSFVYLLLYVDDMLVAAKNKRDVQIVKDQLNGEFGMKDLGVARKILGMEIRRNRKARTLFLSQGSYIEKILKRFNMNNAKAVSTPLAPHFQLSALLSPTTDKEKAYMSRVPYSSAVGSLMYAMICSRPDLSYAVNMVSRYMSNPGKEHWRAVKWIFRYLCGTKDACLHFGKSKNGVVGYVGSDHADDLDRRRSLTGYVFTFGSCAISWKAVLQSSVALTAMEAKYRAINEACKEAIWLNGLFGELSDDLMVEAVFCDNQRAVFLTNNRTFDERTKHVDMREMVDKGDVMVRKISTDDNPANMLSKVLPIAKFEHCSNLVGVHRF